MAVVLPVAKKSPAPRRSAVPSRGRALPLGPFFLGPAIILSAVLFSYPAISTVISSFTVKNGGESGFGFENYVRLFQDDIFFRSILNTGTYAVIYVVGTVGIGVMLGLALYSRIPAHGVWRFVILAPSFLPVAFIGVIWQIGLDPVIGWLSSILGAINPELDRAWLSDPNTAMIIVALVSVIQGAGWPMAIVWTSLQDVPPEILEASVMDGANPFQRTFSILLPYVRDTIVTVTLLQIVFSLKVFDMPWVMTRGGPAHASETLTIFVYNEAFQNQNFEYACAAAVVACVLIVIVTLGYVVASRRKDERA